MFKVFVTGDNHIGKKYDRYPEVKNILIGSRFDCIRDMVKEAEKENCDLFVITGDLFDNVKSVSVQDVKTIAEILISFDGRVLVLPGNHDYYTGEEKVWKDFEKALNGADNVLLLTEMKAMPIDIGDETVVIYPAFCQSKLSGMNNLGWIKGIGMPDEKFHIGIAHGAIEGITPDLEKEYFLMTERELNAIPVDAWLVGHTHIPFPALSEEKEETGYKIYNAGTHEQTDLHNNTDGRCFVLTFDRKDGKKTVSARAWRSGKMRFYDLKLPIRAGEGLEEALECAVYGLQDLAVVRVTVSGAVNGEDYEERYAIYEKKLKRFLTYEVDDTELCEVITPEKIRKEFAEIGFAAEFLQRLLDEPKEAQMAYELLKECCS